MLGETLASYGVAQEMVREAIKIYNEERPHQSLGYEKPSVRHAPPMITLTLSLIP